MIKNIVFDLIGPLVTDGKKIAIKNPSQFGVSKAIITDILYGNEMNLYKLGKITPNQYWNQIYKKHNIVINKKKLIYNLYSQYKQNKQMFKFLKKLGKQNINLFIFSNNILDRVNFLDKKYNLKPFFDKAVFSYDIGYCKPDRKAFISFINKTAINPKDSLFIDDKLSNIEAARKFGFKCVLYRNQKQTIRHINAIY